MPWISRLSFRVLRFLALRLRNMVQRRTVSALAQLDDRALAVIGIPRHGITDYARDLARVSVPLPSAPASRAKPSAPGSRADGRALADAARS
ncbi:MAG: hypothetical protein ACFCUW_01295 [Kiloniellaceae bacterium]